MVATRRTADIAATNTRTTTSLALAELPLALQLCELRLLGENLIPSLLHCASAFQRPISKVSRFCRLVFDGVRGCEGGVWLLVCVG